MASDVGGLHAAAVHRVRLPSKPSAELCYSLSYIPAKDDGLLTSPPRLIVFLNNLLMPASSWQTPITLLNQQRIPQAPQSQHPNPQIPILTYDRFGQGATTSRDPLDSLPTAEPGYGHDFADVVSDLHSLITLLTPQLYPSHHGSDSATPPQPEETPLHLLLIGASIGSPLARLYAATYPRTVSGIILLDSNIANANYSSFWPDPSAPGFDPEEVVAPDCDLEQYVAATKALAKLFDLDVKNGEGLDRRNTPLLLPLADGPRLFAPRSRTLPSGPVEGEGEGKGEGGREEELTKILVVGHDPEAFAEEGWERMGTPRSFTKRWLQSAWDEYNRGLLEVGDSGGFGGRVRIARGCGHFIQRDDPGFVAGVVGEMLDVLGW